ncbi:MAG: 3-hydroxyacyl-CoA dehydrogenase family protein [Planctomycetes bacterium]|nr:3-hydroxyacyl-CoA dehydrogenase family protein [Planctomycetota bacterium]
MASKDIKKRDKMGKKDPGEIRTVGVAGLGVMGRGIAACFLGHGLRVLAYDPDANARAKARTFLGEAVRELVERAGFPPALLESWASNYVETSDLDSFAAADFGVETIFEEEDAKRALLNRLASSVRSDVILASNTSAIPITRLQDGAARPERIVGMHWLQPCHLTRFMEIVRGERTSDETMARAEALAWRIGKEPAIVKKDIRGFIVNRLGYALFREALYLVEQGVADPETIERAWCNAAGWYAGIAGPLRIMDHNLPIYAKVMEELLPQLSDAKDVPRPLREKIAAGKTGAKAGEGFFRYGPGEAEAWEKRFRDYLWDVRAVIEKHRPLDREQRS